MSICIQPCNGFCDKGRLGSYFNEAMWVKVDELFRVEGTRGRAFSVGNCCTHG